MRSEQPDAARVTQLLDELAQGRPEALSDLMRLVYDDLRAVARHRLLSEPAGHTLQPTALVHEAFGRLVGQKAAFRNRAHFFAIAARCKRRVLVDHARRSAAAKRPSRDAAVALEDVVLRTPPPVIEEVMAVNEALDRLAALDARQAQIAEMRYFGNASVDDIASALSISPATVKRDIKTAELFLRRALGRGRDDA
jgi:RNA polymerase sigma-70 factor (ECF subfamily)